MCLLFLTIEAKTQPGSLGLKSCLELQYMMPLTTPMPPQVSQARQESYVAYLNHCGICKYAQCLSQLEYGSQSQLWLVCFHLQMQRKLFFWPSLNYHYKLVCQGNSWPRVPQPRAHFDNARVSQEQETCNEVNGKLDLV